jgi:hypothetical protein
MIRCTAQEYKRIRPHGLNEDHGLGSIEGFSVIQTINDEGVEGTPLTIAEAGVEGLPDTFISDLVLMVGWL